MDQEAEVDRKEDAVVHLTTCMLYISVRNLDGEMRTCSLGGRTSGGFNFLLNISYEIRSFLMNTFFLKKKKKGRVGNKAQEQEDYSVVTGNPSEQFSRTRAER